MRNHYTFLIFAAAMEASCAFTIVEHSSTIYERFGSKSVAANQGLHMATNVHNKYFFAFASTGHRSVYTPSNSKQETNGLDMLHGNYEPDDAFGTQFREPQKFDILEEIAMPGTGAMVLSSTKNANESPTNQKKNSVNIKFDYFDYETDFEDRVGGLHDIDDWSANPPEGGLSDKIDWNARFPAKRFTQTM
mmetsp:Transcript_14357/g.21575  ORF Transcript_14357/g.21575 Transcript_14357/m.21575 type:complete len:191 (+) Transcript_14357:95-667(+)